MNKDEIKAKYYKSIDWYKSRPKSDTTYFVIKITPFEDLFHVSILTGKLPNFYHYAYESAPMMLKYKDYTADKIVESCLEAVDKCTKECMVFMEYKVGSIQTSSIDTVRSIMKDKLGEE